MEYRHLHRGCGRAELHARCRKASGGATASQPGNPSSRRRARCAALCTRPAPGDAHPGGSAFFEHACRILEQTAEAAHRAQRAHRGQTRRVRVGFRFTSRRGASIPPAWRLRSPKVSGVSPARHVGRRTRRRDRPGRSRPGVRLSVERGELRPVLRDEHGKQPCRLGRARVLAHRMGGPRRLEPALAGLPRSNRPQEPRGRVLLVSRHINLRRMQ